MTAGPASSMAFAEPTNSPAPMMPAIEIMVMCRDFRLVPSRLPSPCMAATFRPSYGATRDSAHARCIGA